MASLPYRIGLFVSKSDTRGGEEANQQELQVLSNIINGFARDIFSSEMIQYIMQDTVMREADWPRWARKTASLQQDCQDVLSILAKHGTQKDIRAFQNHMMEIGEAVARAFNEYQEEGAAQQVLRKFEYQVHKLQVLLGREKQQSEYEFLSVSKQEKGALAVLAGALKINPPLSQGSAI